MTISLSGSRSGTSFFWQRNSPSKMSERKRGERGVPFPVVCKNRKERIAAIGDAVAKSDYHIVALQEIWKKSDYEVLKSKITKTLPFSHYFYSGMIGSGLCVFSKIPIEEALFHRFDLNGYAHKVQHGDWFGGKGVGLVKLTVEGFQINLYVSHIHAEYCREDDEYLAHRVSQAFNMSQFIRFTSDQADAIFLCGDMNLEPVDVGYKIICANTGLKDAWIHKKGSKTVGEGNTCDCPTNSFVKKDQLIQYPDGKRIDYIFYRPNKGIKAQIDDCSVTMGKIPDKPFNFSDHEGVEAHVTLTKTDAPHRIMSTSELSPLLQEALTVIDKGLKKTTTDQRFFTMFAAISLSLAYTISVIHIPYPIDFFVRFFVLVLILATGFGIIQNFIMIRSEVHGLTETKEDIKLVLQNLYHRSKN